MPPFSTDDYHKLLQKIAVLETKIYRLEVNVEVNGICGNDSTLPLTQNDGHAMTQLTSYHATKKQEECEPGNKSTGGSPPWNSLGAKPKSKSSPWGKGGRITGRTQRPEICEATGWPALSSRQSASSTPVASRTQPWITAKGRTSSKPPQQPTVQLDNRYSPLSQDARAPSDDLDNLTSHNRVRTESKSESKRLQGKLTTGPQTLIVGDFAVKDAKNMCSKNTKVLCFPKDMVSDLAERIIDIVAAHPTVKSVILHIGANDVVKQESEVLKRDFTELFKTVKSLNVEVFISGPLPPIRRGAERFSRLLALNTWLSTVCATHSVHFINNFYLFWERRHLFKADGLCLNKSGVKLLLSNVFYFLRHPSVPPAKDKRQGESERTVPSDKDRRQENSNQQEDITQRNKNLEISPPQPASEGSPYHGRHQNREEESQPPTSGPPPRLPPEESADHGRHQDQEKESSPFPSPLNNANTCEDPPPSTTNTPSTSPPSPFTLSPSSPLLEFTDQMKELVTAGTKLTPRPTPFFSPQNPPRRPPQLRRQAPLPPARRLQPPSPQPDKVVCGLNAAGSY